jgi:hypothetical protein
MKSHFFSDRGSRRREPKGTRTFGAALAIWKDGARGSRADGLARTSFIADVSLYDAACIRLDFTSDEWVDVLHNCKTKPGTPGVAELLLSVENHE